LFTLIQAKVYRHIILYSISKDHGKILPKAKELFAALTDDRKVMRYASDDLRRFLAWEGMLRFRLKFSLIKQVGCFLSLI